MKRVIQIVAYSVLATAAVLLLMGILMPNHYYVQRSILIAATPAEIHPWVEDLQKWPTWANWDKRDASLVVTYTDQSRGAGAGQHWQSDKSGSGTLTLTQSDPKIGVTFITTMANGTRANGTIAYSETAGTTNVTWTDEGRLPTFLGGFIRGDFEDLLGHHFEEGLRRLKKEVEEQRPH